MKAGKSKLNKYNETCYLNRLKAKTNNYKMKKNYNNQNMNIKRILTKLERIMKKNT